MALDDAGIIDLNGGLEAIAKWHEPPASPGDRVSAALARECLRLQKRIDELKKTNDD